MIPVLVDAAVGLLNGVFDSDNRKEVAIQESKNRRNVEIAKTLVEGAVAAFGAYQQAKANAAPQVQAATSYGNEIDVTPQRAMIAPPEPSFSVDRRSIWVDRARNEMGARVIDESSGQTANVTYKIQSRGNKVHHIYESVNGGKWSQVGVVDWKYQRPSDLGTNETGGPIFAEIMQTAMSRR